MVVADSFFGRMLERNDAFLDIYHYICFAVQYFNSWYKISNEWNSNDVVIYICDVECLFCSIVLWEQGKVGFFRNLLLLSLVLLLFYWLFSRILVLDKNFCFPSMLDC